MTRPPVARTLAGLAALVAGLVATGLAASPSAPAASRVADIVEYVSVADGGGHLVEGLTPTEFEVLVDNRPVAVTSVARSAPLSLTLIIDDTVSMATPRNLIEKAEVALAAELRPGDFVRIAGVTPAERQDLTVLPSLADVMRAAKALIDLSGRQEPGHTGPSPIWDAVGAVTQAMADDAGHRAAILLTDGRATGNQRGFADVLPEVCAAGITTSVIGRGASSVGMTGVTITRIQGVVRIAAAPPGAAVRSDLQLRDLARQTGGRYEPWPGTTSVKFNDQYLTPNGLSATPPNKPPRLGEVLAAMVREFRDSYAISFRTPADGRSHPLEVRVTRPDAFARSRALFLAR